MAFSPLSSVRVIRVAGLRGYFAVAAATVAVVLTLPFLAVGVMGREAVTFLANVPSLEAAETKGFYIGGPVEGNTYAWGNCTYWVYAMRLWAGYPIPGFWGNANSWANSARRDGYVVNQTPSVGAIYQTSAGEYGHVGYVVAVDELTGEWTISEMNNLGLNVVNLRTFSAASASSVNFIHGKKGDEIWSPSEIGLSGKYSKLVQAEP